MALKHDLLQRVVMQNHSKNQWKWSNLWWLNMSNGEGSSRSYSFRNRNGSNFEVSKGIKTSSKKQPQKSWTTLFTTPFINHFREWAHFIYYPFINRYPSLLCFCCFGCFASHVFTVCSVCCVFAFAGICINIIPSYHHLIISYHIITIIIIIIINIIITTNHQSHDLQPSIVNHRSAITNHQLTWRSSWPSIINHMFQQQLEQQGH